MQNLFSRGSNSTGSITNNFKESQISNFLNKVLRLLKQDNVSKLFTFVLISILLISQISGQTGSLISSGFQRKSIIENLIRSLGIDQNLKVSADAIAPTYFTIQSTDSTGTGYKLTTADSTGSENSIVKFTNTSVINDQQKWYFENSTGLIKSAITNKCLATNNNQVWNSIIIKTCNANDNTQVWNTDGNLIKNVSTSKCVVAAWSNVNSSYQNLWFDGRVVQLNDSCNNVNFNFVALPNTSSLSSVSSSTLSSSSSSNTNNSSSANLTQFNTIESTDSTGAGYKLTTADASGLENSVVKFTNVNTTNDQQKWYFDPINKLVKSALPNKCLATIANQVYTNLVLKTCNASDNTQSWDISNNLIKNITTGKCAVANWTQNVNTLNWENRWYDGRIAGLDNGCGWGFRFVPSVNTNSSSSSSSSASSLTINPQESFVYKENGIDLSAAVSCVDDGEIVTNQPSFSIVIKYTNNGDRIELQNSKLTPARSVIHTHFDLKDKSTINYSDPTTIDRLTGPLTYLKSKSPTAPAVESKAMVIQGLGNETVSWSFNINDKFGNTIKNTAGIPRDFGVKVDRNFATKCNQAVKRTITDNKIETSIPIDSNSKLDPTFYTIQPTDSTQINFKLSTLDSTGTENSDTKFTNVGIIDEKQKWYFDSTTKLIKSVINNKCLGTSNNQIWGNIKIKTCDKLDLTQLWDVSNNLIKNV